MKNYLNISKCQQMAKQSKPLKAKQQTSMAQKVNIFPQTIQQHNKKTFSAIKHQILKMRAQIMHQPKLKTSQVNQKFDNYITLLKKLYYELLIIITLTLCEYNWLMRQNLNSVFMQLYREKHAQKQMVSINADKKAKKYQELKTKINNHSFVLHSVHHQNNSEVIPNSKVSLRKTRMHSQKLVSDYFTKSQKPQQKHSRYEYNFCDENPSITHSLQPVENTDENKCVKFCARVSLNEENNIQKLESKQYQSIKNNRKVKREIYKATSQQPYKIIKNKEIQRQRQANMIPRQLLKKLQMPVNNLRDQQSQSIGDSSIKVKNGYPRKSSKRGEINKNDEELIIKPLVTYINTAATSRRKTIDIADNKSITFRGKTARNARSASRSLKYRNNLKEVQFIDGSLRKKNRKNSNIGAWQIQNLQIQHDFSELQNA